MTDRHNVEPFGGLRSPRFVVVACATCTTAEKIGWHGLPSGTSHCRKCHKQWSGTRAAHCPMCHWTFSSDTAAQRHKNTRGGHVECLDPKTLRDEEKRAVFVPAEACGAEWGLASYDD